MNRMNVNQLPEDVKQKVLDTLTTYPTAYVERQNGEYKYIAGVCLDTTIKSEDFAVFEFSRDDVYTKEEQRQHSRENAKYNWEGLNC